MTLESFLVVLKEGVSPKEKGNIISVIKTFGGTVDIEIGQGKIVIARFDNSFAARLRMLAYVKLVGGVTIRKSKR